MLRRVDFLETYQEDKVVMMTDICLPNACGESQTFGNKCGGGGYGMPSVVVCRQLEVRY